MMRAKRIVLDARLVGGISGGIEQALIGMASGLSSLTDGDEEYFFLTLLGSDQWISSYVSGPCYILPTSFHSQRGTPALMQRGLRKLRGHLTPIFGKTMVPVARADAAFEALGANVVHFTRQQAFLTDVPSIYQPHDLQHLHFPSFFSKREYISREKLYRTFCAQAQIVVSMSQWGKQDLMYHYGLSDEKVRVIPWSNVLSAYPEPVQNDLLEAQKKFSLPKQFIFYPAQTWPHKNHINLLDALAIIRDRKGLLIPAIFSGRLNSHYQQIKKRVDVLRLTGQVAFLGFVSSLDLRCLYHLAHCLIFPSKFEGWGLPISEAFASRLPVACSNVTALPEQAGDAAIYFDPDDPEDMAEVILRLWEDETLGRQLIERGLLQVQEFSPKRSAHRFRKLYREVIAQN